MPRDLSARVMPVHLAIGRPASLARVAFSLFALFAAFATVQSVSAQTPPATYYGYAGAGDAVEARHNDVACASTTAGGDGFWKLTVAPGGACGVSEGGSLAFSRNGVDSGARETFKPGGTPSNVAAGVTVGGATGVPAPAPAPAGPRSFTGPVPPSGAAGLLVTSGDASPEALRTSLGAGGCRVQALAVLRNGGWLVYIQGAPSAVNAAFPASLPPTSAFFVRC